MSNFVAFNLKKNNKYFLHHRYVDMELRLIARASKAAGRERKVRKCGAEFMSSLRGTTILLPNTVGFPFHRRKKRGKIKINIAPMEPKCFRPPQPLIMIAHLTRGIDINLLQFYRLRI